ncbi:MAG: 4Fe-4S cluster-binding domain-containing protein [Acidobacteria bacterium]|nr:4Fe-4S cluster-binding domain-containing protein [Acidobacteriota bacterium]
MSKELVFVLEPDAGRVTVEISQAAKQTVDDLAHDLGERVSLNCARPAEKERSLPVLQAEAKVGPSESDAFSIWLYRLYHNSVVDGPGRRSVIQVSGCSIRCEHCIVPQTHRRENGKLVSIPSIVGEIVSKGDEHDGVTILGGEPFDQPDSVAELVSRLKLHGIHVIVYSGYTIEQLIQRKLPSIDYILTHIDLLIDGPFVTGMRENAGEYRGSRNQRFLFKD